MPRLPSIWKIIQYLPIVLGFLNYLHPREAGDSAGNLREEMREFRLSIADRLVEMESESARLHARLREMQAMVLWLRTVIWIGVGIYCLTILIVILIFTVIFSRLP